MRAHRFTPLLCLASAAAFAQDDPGLVRDAVLAGLHLRDGEIVQFTPPAGLPDLFTAIIQTPDRTLAVDLWKYSNRAPAYTLLVAGPDGTLHKHEPGPVNTYRGRLIDEAGSTAAAAIVNGRLTLSLCRADGSWEHLQPAGDAAPDRHVLYRAADVLPVPGARCGNDDTGKPAPAAPPSNVASWFLRAQIAYDSDSAYYIRNGRSVPNTEADIHAINNAVNVVYERDARITHLVTTVIVRTPPDLGEPQPYTSTDPLGLWNEFRTEWNQNQRSVVRDVAHLMTGKELDGNVVGLAWIGTVCDSATDGRGYGLSQSRFSTNFAHRMVLTAHELGHNWNAPHCDEVSPPQQPCGIMCSFVGGCGDHPFFEPYSLGVIYAFADSRGCVERDTAVRWVDFSHAGPQAGTFTQPWRTLSMAVQDASPGFTIAIKSGTSAETARITKPLTVESFSGRTSVGR